MSGSIVLTSVTESPARVYGMCVEIQVPSTRLLAILTMLSCEWNILIEVILHVVTTSTFPVDFKHRYHMEVFRLSR